MSYAEDFEHYMPDDYYYDSPNIKPEKLNKTCSMCNKSGLHWEKNNVGKWRLYEKNGKLHICSELPIILPKNKDTGMEFNKFYVIELITRKNGIKFRTIIKYLGNNTIKLLDYDNKEYKLHELIYFQIINKIDI